MYRLIGRTSHVIYSTRSMEELYEFAQETTWIRCEYRDARGIWHDCSGAFAYMIYEYAMAEEHYERRVAGELKSMDVFNKNPNG